MKPAHPSLLVIATLLAMLAMLAGCGGAQPVATTNPDPGARPLTARPAPGQPGAAPAAPQVAVDQPKRVGPDPAVVHQRWLGQLGNAARRDRAMDLTMRHYMLITREVFRRLRRSGPRSGPTSYDPVPAWQFQGQAARDFRRLSERSGLLVTHLDGLARTWGVPGIDPDESGRGGRIALYRTIFRCIQTDTSRRADHGGQWHQRASKPVALTDMDKMRLYRQELQLMRQSVRCSTLIASRRARN